MMKNQQGFSLLELMLAVILVVVLYVITVDRILPLRGDAEAAHVATTLGTLRSSIGMEIAARLLRNEIRTVPDMDGANPMRWLADPPENYLGEVAGVKPENLPLGHWYFDLDTRELVYIVRYTQYFRTDLTGVPRMVFNTELVQNERGEMAGVRIRRVNAFVWTRSADIAEMLEQR